MNIPAFIETQVVNKDGTFTDSWRLIMTNLLQQLATNAGTEGFVMPSISSANNSVNPSHSGGQLNLITPLAQNGTVIYDPNTDQPKIRLNDGSFHVITTV